MHTPHQDAAERYERSRKPQPHAGLPACNYPAFRRKLARECRLPMLADHLTGAQCERLMDAIPHDFTYRPWGVSEKLASVMLPTPEGIGRAYRADLIWLDADGRSRSTFALAATPLKALRRAYRYRRWIIEFGSITDVFAPALPEQVA